MDKDIVIIGSYPKEKEVISVLKQCIKQLNTRYDTLLVSHYPADLDIQNLVTYYVYDKNNELIKNPTTHFYIDCSEFYVQTNFGNKFGSNAYSVLTSLINGINLIRDKYKSFFYIEGDGIISNEDLHKLDDIKNICFSKGKKASFFTATDYFYTLVFFSDVKFFIDNVFFPKTSKQYFDRLLEIGSHGALENYLHNSFDHNFLYLIQDFPQNYFNKSSIGGLDFSSGKLQKKDYVIDLVKHLLSNDIFFVYSNYSINPEKKDLNIVIDNKAMFTIENNNYSMYTQIHPISDTINLKINDVVFEYKVEDILKNEDTYIKFK